MTATWQVPAGATSGIYIAKPTRTADTTKASHIVFVVRDDTSHSDILVQTSDTTWQAYNPYGGYNLYTGSDGSLDSNAWKVSYNRPFTTRGAEEGENWLFNSEYPMVSWLERNGYDVSYSTHIDTGLHPERLLDHKVFMSSGHDEYWSQAQRDSVTNARDHGVNLAFFSGNEVYWHIRYEDSLLGSSGDQRTMVVYKEGSLAPSPEGEHRRCYLNFSCDPSSEWTGLWRETTTDGPSSSIGAPENALTGQISWRNNTSDITVPNDYASLRFWRNTSVAALTAGQTATLVSGSLGYEWSPQYEQYMGYYPAGRVLLSSTNAVSTFAGVDTHHLSLYRAASGALVFGAGTVQWAWGLDSHHDRTATQGSSAADPAMQQATVNLLADMGAQPTTLQSGLVAADKSTDVTAPTVTITSPADSASVPAGPVTVTGTATDVGGAVGVVEVSTDGTVWRPATGLGTWSFTFTAAQGTTTIHVRAADDSANLGVAVTRTITVTPARLRPEQSLLDPRCAARLPAGPGQQVHRGRGEVPLQHRRLHHGRPVLQDDRQHRDPHRLAVVSRRHQPRQRGLHRRERHGVAGGHLRRTGRHHRQHHVRRVLPRTERSRRDRQRLHVRPVQQPAAHGAAGQRRRTQRPQRRLRAEQLPGVPDRGVRVVELPGRRAVHHDGRCGHHAAVGREHGRRWPTREPSSPPPTSPPRSARPWRPRASPRPRSS